MLFLPPDQQRQSTEGKDYQEQKELLAMSSHPHGYFGFCVSTCFNNISGGPYSYLDVT